MRADQMTQSPQIDHQAVERYLLLQARRRDRIRSNLPEWAVHALAASGFSPATHHRALLDELEALASGRTDRLMVLMPPGSAKSTYTSVIFPAWWMARYPKSSVIAASHTADLAEFFSRRLRELISDHGPSLGIAMAHNENSAQRWRLQTGGQYFASGLRGPLTGRRADLVVIDDPIKSHSEADSLPLRNSIWEWYRSDLLTRLTPGGRIVLVMTRWHEDDLGGRLLNQNMQEWRVLRLPAFAEPDDPLNRPVGAPLWPEWEDTAALHRKRDGMGERAWSALFQQLPWPATGQLFKVQNIAVLDAPPQGIASNVVRAWDLAATQENGANDPDWTVGLKLHREESGRFVVLDIVRLRASPYQVQDTILNAARQDGSSVVVSMPQDPGSSGKFAVSMLIRQMAGYNVVSSRETGSKATRATPVAVQVEAGNVAMVRADWNQVFLEELKAFPHGRKDDQVDALSRAFAELLLLSPPSRRLSLDLLGR
jgi:predicted phage terminase large subunit-like protein